MAHLASARRPTPPAHRKEVLGILFFALGFFVSLSLFSYNPADPGLNAASNVEHISNLGGILGAYLSDILFTTLGLSAYTLAGLFFLLSMLKFKGETIGLRFLETAYYLVFLVSISTLFQIYFPETDFFGQQFAGGGFVGSLFASVFVHYLNPAGAQLVGFTLLILSFILATHLKISNIAVNAYRLMGYFGVHLAQWGRVSFERWKKSAAVFWRWISGQFHSMFGEVEGEKSDTPLRIHTSKPALIPITPVAAGKPLENENLPPGELKIFGRADSSKKLLGEDQLKFLKISGTGFTTPPISLLDSDKQQVAAVDEEVLKKNAHMLEKKLMDYEVEGKVTEIHPGPVITMYEFEPIAGTKVNKIVNLESDLSLTMGGKSIRIVPHIPGKAAVGIEIPNHERETVWLKEIIASPAFQKSKSKLTLALGKDIEGHPMVTDLTKMPHLLIAGATGAGKSVGINSMIISLLYKTSPEDVRFIFIDPKRLELNIYEGIPHLLLPVVTEPKQAVAALKWALREMERRYRLLADVGTRNIATYNEKIEKNQIELVSEEEAHKKTEINKEAVCHTGKLYYLVVMIDELADMMMIASQEFEETITRLAQMARAAGIHLILATQRPSVDVVTGLIKANFPARISFKVSSRHDSRTILDQMGSESLLGNGDMLFMPPAASNLIRIHGSLVTEQEIARVVGCLKEQGSPIYDPSLLEASTQKENPNLDLFDDLDDELYDKAVQIVAETRQASISMIQRRMRIGYNRAARMVERMEAEGVVGPQDGSKPRQVLVNNLENPT